MKLKMAIFVPRSLKKVVTENLTQSPHIFINRYNTEKVVNELVDDVTAKEVTVYQWWRVLGARDGKRRVKVVSTNMALSEFNDQCVQDLFLAK